MSEIAVLFAEMMLNSHQSAKTRKQLNNAQDTHRRRLRHALAAEIGFIKQTLDHITLIDDEPLADGARDEINDWIAEITDEIDELSSEDFTDEATEELAYNIRLYFIAQASHGRLSTMVYEGSVEQIGLLTANEITPVVYFYSFINMLKDALDSFAASVQTAGAIPDEFLSPIDSLKRQSSITDVKSLTEAAIEADPQDALQI